MLKKTITYPDLDGNPVTEDFYFNLSKAEIAEMELSHKDGLSGYLNTIVESQDGSEIIATFKTIIATSVGVRSEDGKRFIKNDEIRDNFLQTNAYSELFMELATNAEAAAEFIRGIVPADLAKNMVEEAETPAYVLENRAPTKDELASMTPQQLQEAFKNKFLKSVD